MSAALPRLASSPAQVYESIMAYHEAMEGSNNELKEPLINIMNYIKSWIAVLDNETGKYIFAPSKFCGYFNMDPETYIENHNMMSGSETEKRIKKWVRLLNNSDKEYDEAYEQLHDYCGKFGKRTNMSGRISILLPFNEEETTEGHDNALVDLLVKVFHGLPEKGQQEVRRRINAR